MTRVLLVMVALAACSERDRDAPRVEPERQHRVIEPPSGPVRPLPPHAIRADGVGPYRLGAALDELVGELPSGPRIETIDIPGVAQRSILRGEDDAIVIGGEPRGKASFVAVIGSDIARTESGVHVGSTRDELVRALGAPIDDPERPHDPRLVVPSELRNARVLLDDDRDRVIAIAIVDEAARAVPPPDPTDHDDRVPAAETERTLARIPGLVFHAALGHDELIAVWRTDEPQQRTWALRTFRADGAHWAAAMDAYPLYQLSAQTARWNGADLRDLDLYLDLHVRPDSIEVGGLLTRRIGAKLHDVVVISTVQVPRRRAKSAPPEAPDAGLGQAASDSDGSGSDRHASP